MLWERWFLRPAYTGRPEAEGGKPLTVLYSENDGTEAVYLAGKPMASGGMIALPSLTLNYYAFVALIVLAAAVLVRIFVQEAASLRLDGTRDPAAGRLSAGARHSSGAHCHDLFSAA